MSSSPDNLEKISSTLFVKNYIISSSPKSPTNGRNSSPNLLFIIFPHIIQPSTKHISKISWWRDVICKVHHTPYNPHKRALNKQMINGFHGITKTTLLISLPLSFS
jgi:hypothetical protein